MFSAKIRLWASLMAAVAVSILATGVLAGGQPAADAPMAIGASTQPASAPSGAPAGVPATQAAEILETAPSTSSGPGAPAAETGLDGIKVSHPGSFDVNFQNTELRLALRLLSTQGHKNIIVTKDVSGTVSADLYGVTFAEALEAVLKTGGYVYQEKGNFIYVMTPKQLDEVTKSEQKLSVRTFRLAYIMAADAKLLIQPALSADGTIALTPAVTAGITTSATDAGGNSYATEDVLVVRDYEENLRHVEEMLRDLDTKPDQVLIEATILRATLNENNALGFDFNSLGGLDFSQLNTTSNGLTSATTGQLAALPGRNVNYATFQTDFNSAIDPGGMTIGFMTNNLAFFIRALEDVTDVTVMANPKLLIVNKQRGEVMIGNKDGYVTTTVTETVATQTVQMLETGTHLIVRPFITKNGLIRMEIHPEDSSGSVKQVGAFVLPSETTTEVTSNVLVRDGHTIVIGGLFRENTGNARSQVPGVGNIPILGNLFRRTEDTTTREEVIILITPRIIRQEVDEATGEQMKDDVERLRLGQRKGMQWWGRDRLAQGYMRMAKDDISHDRRTLALWNLDLALSMSPRMIEAVDLHEKLTQKAYWADESRYTSARFMLQQMMMNDLGKPVETIIPPQKPRDPRKIDPEVRDAFGIEILPEQPLPLGKGHRSDPAPEAASQPSACQPKVQRPANGQVKQAPVKADQNQ